MKKIAIVPYDRTKLQDKLFSINTEDKCCENRENVFRLIYEVWNNEEYECHTIDYYKDLSEVDVAVFYAFDEEYILKCHKHSCLKVYVMLEPETVVPVNGIKFQHRLQECFDYILTYNELFKGDRFIRSMMPYSFCNICLERIEKKGITLVTSNKRSRESASAYDKRAGLINYLNEQEPEFKLYGSGWDDRLRAYKGKCLDKLLVASESKYLICMENTISIPGYITEKIFDAFAAGCVPIYFGTESIKKYINPRAYICMTDFETYDKLLNHIRSISTSDYEEMLSAGKVIVREFNESDFETQKHVKRLEGLFGKKILVKRTIKISLWLWNRRFQKFCKKTMDRIYGKIWLRKKKN